MVIIIVIIFLIMVITLMGISLYQNNNYIKTLRHDFEYSLYHDSLTGHTNWDWLWLKIGHSTDECFLNYDLVHFDVKDFKLFNELYDHKVGDEVLKFISKNLSESEFILYSARCHNDNFAFVPKPYLEMDLNSELENLFERMKYLPGFEERPIYYRCGVVEKNQKLRANDTVADMAKMAQKLGTKINCTEIIWYDDNMRDRVLRGENLKNNLPEAILRDEILVYFQPKFDANNEKIVGSEALVRWMFHGKEFMTPNLFIPYLEECNAIQMLDHHIIEKVCRYFVKWKNEGKRLYPVSINLSQNEIQDENLVKNIVDIVDRYDVDRGLIEFEITETATYSDAEYFLRVINEFRNEGFMISMDDFGTGYSSFKLLKDMPLNTLKIDKSFVDSISSSSDNYKGELILQDIISMAKHLSMFTVAEGVEELKQKEQLKIWGCDYIQGFYYSKPIPAEEYEQKYL